MIFRTSTIMHVITSAVDANRCRLTADHLLYFIGRCSTSYDGRYFEIVTSPKRHKYSNMLMLFKTAPISTAGIVFIQKQKIPT